MNPEELLDLIVARNEQNARAAYEKALGDAISAGMGTILMLAAENACTPLRALHVEIQSLKP